jgi:hypothetical protein
MLLKDFIDENEISFNTNDLEKGKAVPLQAWSGPEIPRKLRVRRFLDNSTGWW